MFITPERAAALLAETVPCEEQRLLDYGVTEGFIARLLAGDVRPDPAISFCLSRGTLALHNGQHRLTAIARAGVGCNLAIEIQPVAVKCRRHDDECTEHRRTRQRRDDRLVAVVPLDARNVGAGRADGRNAAEVGGCGDAIWLGEAWRNTMTVGHENGAIETRTHCSCGALWHVAATRAGTEVLTCSNCGHMATRAAVQVETATTETPYQAHQRAMRQHDPRRSTLL